ncbi:hypothetical protein N9X25_03815 [Verrucomicrobiales bacterium]|jgi:hypothetical protein|nr:hypothetical protein [Verrucomicrobiales bacterium]
MKKLVTIFAAFGLFAAVVQAQNLQLGPNSVDVKKVEVEVQKTPQFQAGGVNNKNIPNPRDWLEVEVEFEVDARAPDNAVVGELLFRYYIGFKDQRGTGRTITGDVKHKNVMIGEETYSAVYVSPDTLGEITGEYSNFQSSDVAAVGVEIFYNGVLVGGYSSLSGTKAKFWEATGTGPGILSKHETPFALLWIDRYADVDKN